MSAGAPAWPWLLPAGLGAAAALVSLPYLARSLDPRGSRSRFVLFHLFYSAPIVLGWLATVWLLLSGGEEWRLDADPSVIVPLLMVMFATLLTAHLVLIGAARRRKRAELAGDPAIAPHG